MKNFVIMVVAATVLLAVYSGPVAAQTGFGGTSILSLAPWAGFSGGGGGNPVPQSGPIGASTLAPAPWTGSATNSGFLVSPAFDLLFANPPVPWTGSATDSGFLVSPAFDLLFTR